MSRWKKIILVNIAIILLLMFFMESISSIAWYQKHKSYNNSISSTIDVLGYLSSKLKGNPDPKTQEQHSKLSKSEKVLKLRKDGLEAYPAYLFDPQLHIDPSVYHLANPIMSSIVYCNENDFWATFKTDEIGFRNPKGQLGRDIDFVFIGDSFTEGACVKDKDTFAGVFRENGFSVLNLGRGGSGPLFQLATLREYGSTVNPKVIVWFVFTGNDLKNLREEKTTKLFLYLESNVYSQNLLSRKQGISEQLKTFLEKQILLTQERHRLGLPNPLGHAYGETLDKIEAERIETVLLNRVAKEILSTTKKLGAKLFVVIINHVRYNQAIQDITSKSILDFANETATGYYVLPRKRLVNRKAFLYSKAGGHFNPDGYKVIAMEIIEELNKQNLTHRNQ